MFDFSNKSRVCQKWVLATSVDQDELSLNAAILKFVFVIPLYGKCSKISNLLLKKMLLFMAGILKLLVRIANSTDLDQIVLGVYCLSRPFGQVT